VNYLLDTHALVWVINAPERLSPAVRGILEKGAVAVSVASLWEMLLKKGNPKNEIVPDPVSWWKTHVVDRGVKIFDIQYQHVGHLDQLPPIHKDPFDRILMCQCIVEGLRLITNDRIIRDHYQGMIHCVW
jgi:PIN domain nuclease of toxin-antitoxin system